MLNLVGEADVHLVHIHPHFRVFCNRTKVRGNSKWYFSFWMLKISFKGVRAERVSLTLHFLPTASSREDDHHPTRLKSNRLQKKSSLRKDRFCHKIIAKPDKLPKLRGHEDILVGKGHPACLFHLVVVNIKVVLKLSIA